MVCLCHCPVDFHTIQLWVPERDGWRREREFLTATEVSPDGTSTTKTMAVLNWEQELRDDLTRAGLLDSIGSSMVFPTLPTAVEGFHQWLDDHPPGDVSG